MKNKSVLIVSQSGKPVRSITINFFTVFFPLLFIACGFAAYFIPSDLFRVKAAEQHQKKELVTQNELLHQRFFSTLHMLSNAKEQINEIDAKKESVSALTGTGADEGALSSREEAATYAGIKPAALLMYVCRRDSAVSAFAARAAAGRNPFEQIPVCKPISGASKPTRCFGNTTDPFTGQLKQHYGIDFAAPVGAPVIATASGYVARIENDEVWGKRVVIDHSKGFSTVYAHLGMVNVGRNRRVRRGDIVGYIGISGLTTGPHVHYEIWRNGIAVDPETYFFPARGKQ